MVPGLPAVAQSFGLLADRVGIQLCGLGPGGEPLIPGDLMSPSLPWCYSVRDDNPTKIIKIGLLYAIMFEIILRTQARCSAAMKMTSRKPLAPLIV